MLLLIVSLSLLAWVLLRNVHNTSGPRGRTGDGGGSGDPLGPYDSGLQSYFHSLSHSHCDGWADSDDAGLGTADSGDSGGGSDGGGTSD